MQAVKFADYRPERPRRCLKNIEVLKQQDAIAGNIEDSAPRTPAVRGWNQRAEERFEEMELNCVASWRNGDGVAEITVPFSGVKSGDLRPRFGILIEDGAPLDEVIVPAPVRAAGIYKTRWTGGNPDRLQLSRRTRGNFQRTDECRPSPTRKELEVELAVRRWVHILENTDVDRSGTGVGNRDRSPPATDVRSGLSGNGGDSGRPPSGLHPAASGDRRNRASARKRLSALGCRNEADAAIAGPSYRRRWLPAWF